MTVKDFFKSIDAKAVLAACAFFGFAFTLGAATGWIVRGARIDAQKPDPIIRVVRVAAVNDDMEEIFDVSGDEAESVDVAATPAKIAPESKDEILMFDGTENQTGDLVLEEHALGEDDGGFFITGVVKNKSSVAYDAVQIEFELYNKSLDSYAVLSERTRERVDAGGEWEFTSYIPYTYLKDFASYRLYSLMGVKGK